MRWKTARNNRNRKRTLPLWPRSWNKQASRKFVLDWRISQMIADRFFPLFDSGDFINFDVASGGRLAPFVSPIVAGIDRGERIVSIDATTRAIEKNIRETQDRRLLDQLYRKD